MVSEGVRPIDLPIGCTFCLELVAQLPKKEETIQMQQEMETVWNIETVLLAEFHMVIEGGCLCSMAVCSSSPFCPPWTAPTNLID